MPADLIAAEGDIVTESYFAAPMGEIGRNIAIYPPVKFSSACRKEFLIYKFN